MKPDATAGSSRLQDPVVSVICPVRNEAAFIQRSLGAILRQDYPKERLEVLVVDGMSEDATKSLAREMADVAQKSAPGGASPPSRVEILDNNNRSAPAALNIGLSEARGEVIVLVGGHCEIPHDYIRRCVDALDATSTDCVGGSLLTVGETRAARAIALAMASRIGVGNAAFRTSKRRPRLVDTVAFGAYRREVFDKIGGFDEELVRNQDDEFNFRLTQAGGRIWFDPSIQTMYYSRAELTRLWRQYFEYGLYKVRVIQKRRGVPAARQLAPPAFVLALVAGCVCSIISRDGRWALAVPVPYVLATLVASGWVSRKQWSLLPLVSLACMTMHLSYGLGFLQGIWRWSAARERRAAGRAAGTLQKGL